MSGSPTAQLGHGWYSSIVRQAVVTWVDSQTAVTAVVVPLSSDPVDEPHAATRPARKTTMAAAAVRMRTASA